MRVITACLGTAILALAGVARGQASFPAAFVCNNGNLEGSVTSYRVNQDGTITYLQKLVLAAREASEPADPGTNAYSISITPNGRFLAISHATSFSTSERISIVEVNADGTLTWYANVETYDSPLAIQWVTDTLFAVTRTQTSGTNNVILYRWDPVARTTTRTHFANTTGFMSTLAITSDRRFIACNESPLNGSPSARVYEIVNERVEFRSSTPTGTGYAIGFGFSSDDRHLYVSGGSLTPYAVAAFALGSDGSLTPCDASPYPSIGSSPKQAVSSPDGSFIYVGHGTDASIVAMQRDPLTGALSNPILAYDVGSQSSLGDIAAMRVYDKDLLFFTDKGTFDGTPRGLFSAEINADGSLDVRSERIDTLGVGPNDIALWDAGLGGEPCVSDLDNGSGTGTPDNAVTIDDLLFFLVAFEEGSAEVDLDNGTFTGTPDNAVTIDDLLYFLVRFEEGC
jgi:6-phosphogluconolactonase (cycloisomerase 2 family)